MKDSELTFDRTCHAPQLDMLPALCNVDYAGMECLHARLVRTTTLGSGSYCDYAICGDQDTYIKEHPGYRDPSGARRNK